jgi:hypothetical protein
MTPATFQHTLCPTLAAGWRDQRAACLGSACALWRWIDPPPAPRAVKFSYPYEEDVAALLKGEPPRPARVPAHWLWLPLVQDGEDEEGPTYTGGYWEEPRGPIEADNLAKANARRAYCGLGPTPAVFP